MPRVPRVHVPALSVREVAMDERYRALIVTVSDRASAGVYEDRTGPAVAERGRGRGLP